MDVKRSKPKLHSRNLFYFIFMFLCFKLKKVQQPTADGIQHKNIFLSVGLGRKKEKTVFMEQNIAWQKSSEMALLGKWK